VLTRDDTDTLLRDLEARVPAMAKNRATFHERFNDVYFAIAVQSGGRDHRYLEDQAADMLERHGIGFQRSS
jgi:hypothetical protein